MRGKVKWYNHEKGFGFITTKAGDDGLCTDLFTHQMYLRDGRNTPIGEGDEVEFEIVDTNRGQVAGFVHVIKTKQDKTNESMKNAVRLTNPTISINEKCKFINSLTEEETKAVLKQFVEIWFER